MAQKRELLEKLLIKLDEWANEKGSEWFKEELKKKFSKSSFDIALKEKINSIEKYLALDSVRKIDYSEVEHKDVKSQLERDCIEMYRYRYGSLRHEITFEECCRYAHMQSEELLNYFFSYRSNNDLNKIIEEIKLHNKDAKISESTKSIGQINYTVKLFTVSKMKIITQPINDEFNLLNKVRNKLSHRHSYQREDKMEVENYIKHADFDFLFQSLNNQICLIIKFEKNTNSNVRSKSFKE